VISYLQLLIRAKEIMLYDEILQATFRGTNLPVKAVSCCHHPVRTDDGATAYVPSRIQH